ncbi:MAG: hypothetical protein Q8Q29_07850 [Actinomycetota bacterium]|nr:hypothetical protein [Actinomycetota bacterium]
MDEVVVDEFDSGLFDFKERPLSEADLARPEIGEHPVVRFLQERGTPASDVGYIYPFGRGGCEGPGYTTRFVPRQPWVVFLMIEPMTDTPITLTEVVGVLAHDDADDVPVAIGMPPVAVNQSEAVLIPLGLSLPPFGYREEYVEPEWDDTVGPGHYQRVKQLDPAITEAQADDFETIRPFMTPQTVRFTVAGSTRETPVHKYDPTRALAVDTFWHTGTCPHLFECFADGDIRHIRELLPDGGDGWAVDFHTPSADCSEIILAELEFEVTHIQFIEQAGATLLGPTVLHRGDSVRVKLRSSETLRIVGRYMATEEVTRPGGSLFKIAVVEEFLARFRRRRGLGSRSRLARTARGR